MSFESAVNRYNRVWSRLSPEEREEFNQRVLVVHAIYGTTTIEGTQLVEEEVADVLAGVKTPRYLQKDVREVMNVLRAMKFVESNLRKPMSENLIKMIHLVVMRGLLPEPGKYRTVPVRVGSSKKPHYDTVPGLMKSLVFNFNMNLRATDIDPLMLATIFHAEFETIHPFRNGNGRVGRLLFSWMMRGWGFPSLVLSLDDVDDYYDGISDVEQGYGYKLLYKFFKKCYEVLADKIEEFAGE
jgi:Fic family protein